MRRRLDKKRRALLAEITSVISDNYHTLEVVATVPEIVVRGGFPVRFQEQVVDRFLVEIVFPRNYPKSIPLVYELSGRIPRVVDNHVYTDGGLCVLLPDERWKYWGEGKGVQEFFAEVVNDFCLGWVYREQHPEYPFGERRHGVLGIRDYYTEELGTADIKVILRCLDYLSRKRFSGRWECYCGSGKQMRHCHLDTMRRLKDNIPRRVAAQSLEKFLDLARQAAENG